MRPVPVTGIPYREFQFPLNVFMHMLTLEEGSVTYLHYGLFDDPGDSIATAQERSTELLLSRLPPPPARVLDVGVGIGTTLAKLTRLGYQAVGITPDESQASAVRARHGDAVEVVQVAFERLFPRGYDVVVFQESSQYIDTAALFAKSREITNSVIVLDEFSTEAGGTLHDLAEFVKTAASFKFRLVEETDLSPRAAPTIDYFLERLPRYRPILERDLGLGAEQVDGLIDSGRDYRERYRRGAYVYRLLRFQR
jgi:SAM-dependent methyltransferase